MASKPAVRTLYSAGGRQRLESLPRGLETSLSDRDEVNLSHGQWQIVALARSAMRQDPALLVLDDRAEHERMFDLQRKTYS